MSRLPRPALAAALLFLIKTAVAQPSPTLPPFSIDTLERRTFDFFWQTADRNAQTPDRWPNLSFSSIAATGFGLSAYLVGAERGYVSREAAAARTLACLSFLKNLPQGPAAEGMGGHRGFFYHFIDHERGRRFKDVELSTIDTGLLMAGILSAQAYFDGDGATERQVRELAQQLFDRVEWDWFLNSNYRLSMGWKPETGFIQSDWNGYNEGMILYILGLGSLSHPLPVKCWEAWTAGYYFDQFEGREQVNFGPLFGHQYSHVWVDFRGISDPYMKEKGFDYFENSRRATLSNRDFCAKSREKHPHFNENCWGLTACDGPADYPYENCKVKKPPCPAIENFGGYSARGAASDYLNDDGTIAPTAAGASIPFAPTECLAALGSMWAVYGDSLVGRYGFKDAFNPSFTACGELSGGWFDPDYLGIDQGPMLLMLENWRSGLLWRLMKKSPVVVRGLHRAGFTGGWIDGAEPKFFKKTSPAFVNPEIPLDTRGLFSKKNFRAAEKEGGSPLPYRLLAPAAGELKTQKPKLETHPLVIFLHGSGERGSDNEAQLKNGALAFADPLFQKKHPCFVLVPQCPTGSKWHSTDRDAERVTLDFDHQSAAGRSLLALIDSVLAQNPGIDRDRIYLTGLSMGGLGTFELAVRRPGFFAAAMPVCGGADLRFAQKLDGLPMRIFHGAHDEIVPPKYDRDLIELLKKGGNCRAEYLELPEGGHNIWDGVYFDGGNLDWLFSQKR